LDYYLRSRGTNLVVFALVANTMVAQLLHMALGVFTSAGVVHLRVQLDPNVSTLGDLMLYSLDELEEVAAEKGGIARLLDEKWRHVYQANNPRGLFTKGELRAA
jgi:hypothetical protein